MAGVFDAKKLFFEVEKLFRGIFFSSLIWKAQYPGSLYADGTYLSLLNQRVSPGITTVECKNQALTYQIVKCTVNFDVSQTAFLAGPPPTITVDPSPILHNSNFTFIISNTTGPSEISYSLTSPSSLVYTDISLASALDLSNTVASGVSKTISCWNKTLSAKTVTLRSTVNSTDISASTLLYGPPSVTVSPAGNIAYGSTFDFTVYNTTAAPIRYTISGSTLTNYALTNSQLGIASLSGDALADQTTTLSCINNVSTYQLLKCTLASNNTFAQTTLNGPDPIITFSRTSPVIHGSSFSITVRNSYAPSIIAVVSTGGSIATTKSDLSLNSHTLTVPLYTGGIDYSFNCTNRVTDDKIVTCTISGSTFTSGLLLNAVYDTSIAGEIKRGATRPSLISSGITKSKIFLALKSIKTAGSYPLSSLKAQSFTIPVELCRAGFTATQFKDAGFTFEEAYDAGFLKTQLSSAGYTFTEYSETLYTDATLTSTAITNWINLAPKPDLDNPTHVRNWKTGQVTTMRGLFQNKRTFTDDISRWDTSNVTDMAYMFGNDINQIGTMNPDVVYWDTAKVREFGDMFSRDVSFNQDIGAWKTSLVFSMVGMFSGCSSFNQDIGGWDLSSNLYCHYMFSGCTAFNQDISGWDVRTVRYFTEMFKDATSFDQNLGRWVFQGARLSNPARWWIEARDMFLGATKSKQRFPHLIDTYPLINLPYSLATYYGNPTY